MKICKSSPLIPGFNYQADTRKDGIKLLEVHPKYEVLLPGLMELRVIEDVYTYFSKKSHHWHKFYYAGKQNTVKSVMKNVIRIQYNPLKRKFRFFKNSAMILFHAREAFVPDIPIKDKISFFGGGDDPNFVL